MNKKTDDFENFETQVWKPVAEKNILAGNLRQWILVEAIGRSENAYSGWTHLAFNVQAENPGEWVGMSGFKWEKLWDCLLYTSPSPRDLWISRMPSSA